MRKLFCNTRAGDRVVRYAGNSVDVQRYSVSDGDLEKIVDRLMGMEWVQWACRAMRAQENPTASIAPVNQSPSDDRYFTELAATAERYARAGKWKSFDDLKAERPSAKSKQQPLLDQIQAECERLSRAGRFKSFDELKRQLGGSL